MRKKNNPHLGYNTDFLGPTLPLPKLRKTTLAPRISGNGCEIQYTHFSVFVNKDRRLPAMTALNIKGEAYTKITREGNEPWDFSNQIKTEFQIDNRFYSKDDNTFDRGHLVRRVDPCWGGVEIATLAENETFRWVNCTPQHKKLNQRGGAWFQLEQHVMENGVKDKLADICVFSGPVLNPNDKIFIRPYLSKDVQIPAVYWKIIVWKKTNGKLYAVGFMMDQMEWIKHKLKEPAIALTGKRKLSQGLPDDYFEKLKFNDNKTYQVRIPDIQRATGINFAWSDVQFPYKSPKPKAILAQPLKEIYPFDIYLKTKIKLSAAKTKSITPQKISAVLKGKGHTALSKKQVNYSLKNGYGGVLKQFNLLNVSL